MGSMPRVLRGRCRAGGVAVAPAARRRRGGRQRVPSSRRSSAAADRRLAQQRRAGRRLRRVAPELLLRRRADARASPADLALVGLAALLHGQLHRGLGRVVDAALEVALPAVVLPAAPQLNPAGVVHNAEALLPLGLGHMAGVEDGRDLVPRIQAEACEHVLELVAVLQLAEALAGVADHEPQQALQGPARGLARAQALAGVRVADEEGALPVHVGALQPLAALRGARLQGELLHLDRHFLQGRAGGRGLHAEALEHGLHLALPDEPLVPELPDLVLVGCLRVVAGVDQELAAAGNVQAAARCAHPDLQTVEQRLGVEELLRVAPALLEQQLPARLRLALLDGREAAGALAARRRAVQPEGARGRHLCPGGADLRRGL
mmetsp:Transcript_46383/g.140731  ORF Transcript_46383/g.140731 Transcript_46383/m.140731 type:complete len:378 (+) Transcript_46383:2-1135(+)